MTHETVINLNGIAGPTHHYGGLAHGNLASACNELKTSNPRKAALQCIEKMQILDRYNIPQGFIPPLRRPRIDLLYDLGFRGSDEHILEKAYRTEPSLISTIYSSASMWTANAATITAASDSEDGKVHISPANLSSNLHRSLETKQTAIMLKQILNDKCYIHHNALPHSFCDEGAANHMRTFGLNIFVAGYSLYDIQSGRRFQARQAVEASKAIIRRHRIQHAHILIQNPDVVDLGVFHNDVIAVSDENSLFFHAEAFKDFPEFQLPKDKNMFRRTQGSVSNTENDVNTDFQMLIVSKDELSIQDAVKSYLFNSQIFTMPDLIHWNRKTRSKTSKPTDADSKTRKNKQRLILLPTECQEIPAVKDYIEADKFRNFFSRIEFIDVRESMQNGGGPACLRLRIPLQKNQTIDQRFLFQNSTRQTLENWVHKHYRDTLSLKDLSDPNYYREVQNSFDDLAERFHISEA